MPAALMLLLLPAAPALGDDPGPAVEVVAIRPDRQAIALIDLFDGTPWPHPAAALADWKRSALPGEERSLGKPLEALIAALNPMMARELATLDGARLRLDLDDKGLPRWSAVVPGDDGTIAAFATAMALTDGAPMAPEGPFRVDRLGPPGSLLLASGERADPVILASDREALASAVARPAAGPANEPAAESGWIIRVDPSALAASGSVPARQVAAALTGLGYGAIEAHAALRGETLAVVAQGPPGAVAHPDAWGSIDPRWLDLVPDDRAAAVVSVAIGPGGDAWGVALEAADRVDRADPARAEAAPLRQRLALFALLRGARLDADLWPNLAGMTLWLSLDESGAPDAGVLALHAPGEAGADRIADEVVAPIAGVGIQDEGASIQRLAELGGRPLELARLGSSVLIGWGEDALASSLSAVDDPSRSAGMRLVSGWDDTSPARLAAAWPGRLPWLGEAGDPLREALEPGPPLVWLGGSEGGAPRDLLRWDGLRAPVRRFLERLPAGPSGPPNPAGDLP